MSISTCFHCILINLVRRNCGTAISPEEILSAEKSFQGSMSGIPALASAEWRDSNIDVVWHVISKDNTDEGGNVP
jgi:hypothetical protein